MITRPRRARRNRWSLWVIAVLVAAGGCASSPPPSGGTDGGVTLIQAETQIPEDQLLDVVIQVFDPGLPEEGEELPPGVFPDVRKAESRFMAVKLADTLQGTGQWGAVRVAPALPTATDLTVSGTIIASTGKKLVVSVLAVDATGEVWLNRKYKQEANSIAYVDEAVEVGDPFDSLYIRIANDLLLARRDTSNEQVESIRQVASLQFAAELLPTVYSDHLERDRKGRVEVVRLPAADDPMMERIAKVEERESMFVDVLNQHYAYFYEQMVEPYDSWRKFSYEEQVALEAIRKKARTQKIIGAIAVLGAILVDPSSGAEAAVRDAAVLGGMAAIQAGMATSKEARIHVEALQELGASFDSEVEPLVIEVEGHTIRLTGSVEEQYTAWRELLQKIYSTETGLPLDPNVTDQTTSAPTPRES